MKSPLHILHLEDDLNDAGLVQACLESDGIECVITRVQTREGFIAAIERGCFDLVLSDFALPSFDGLSAVAIVRARAPDLPIILVSGTLGEEVAIDSLNSGATDYVLKVRLTRLAPAVRRAMLEVEERQARLQMEAQFLEAQKMEVIGQLASGVAHDFNNVIGVVLGYSSLIASSLDPDHALHKYNEEIRIASERAAALTRQLLLFSCKQTVKPVVVNLNAVVEDLDKMLRRLISENIEMNFTPGEGLLPILADANYIGQVLMNLVVNARDAMPTGGRIAIATSNVTLDEEYERTHRGVKPGEYVMLTVSDTGAGMTEEVKARLFEAFFTTKPKGKGTGLGLATCRNIVQRCAGHIEVESELGKGATFKVCFPRATEPVAAEAEIPAELLLDHPLTRGHEMVLVVEDDAPVRNLACRVLEERGYGVLSATNGKEALHLVRGHRGSPIRLVITDVIMPLMGGEMLAEWLKTANPDLKVLFISGYTGDTITHHRMLSPGVEFLAKPYSPAILLSRVRNLLDQETVWRSEADEALHQMAGFSRRT